MGLKQLIRTRTACMQSASEMGLALASTLWHPYSDAQAFGVRAWKDSLVQNQGRARARMASTGGCEMCVVVHGRPCPVLFCSSWTRELCRSESTRGRWPMR
jgi:hypothetical protein